MYFQRFKDCIYLFLVRGEGREKERKRRVGGGDVIWLPLTQPQLGTWPATRGCALTGTGISELLVCRPALSPLSHTSQGS